MARAQDSVTQETASEPKPRRFALRRFRHDGSGATAVEFALLALPFFLLTFAILETFLFFFAAQTVDTATQAASRLIRTGQAQTNGYGATEFKSKICEAMADILNCDANLRVDVRTIDTFAEADIPPPLDEDGNLDDAGFDYAAGGAGDIVVVRVYYEWPLQTDVLRLGLTNVGNTRLIGAVTAFRIEPF